MIKEISYTGLTTTPDDYHAEEGTLSYAQDLISQHESLVNPPLPEQTLLLPTNSKLLYVHKQPNYTNNIYYTTGKLFYTTSNDANKIRLQIEQINNRLVTISNRLAQDNIDIADLNARKEAYITAGGHEYDKAYQVILIQIGNLESEISSLTSEMNNKTTSLRLLQQQLDIIERGSSQNHDLTTISEEPIQVTSVGNNLCILTSTGMIYALFQDGAYIIIPAHIPAIDFRCALNGQFYSMQYEDQLITYRKYGVLKEEDYTEILATKNVNTNTSGATPNKEFTIELSPTRSIKAYENLFIRITGINKTFQMILYVQNEESTKIELFNSKNNQGETTKEFTVSSTNDFGGTRARGDGTSSSDSGYYRPTVNRTDTFDKFILYINISEASLPNITINIMATEEYTSSIAYDPENDVNGYSTVTAAINQFRERFVINKHMFINPFFVRIAFRMYDNSFASPSAPVLMIPNSGTVPFTQAKLSTIAQNEDQEIYNIIVSAVCCNLELQLKNIYNSSEFSKYKDLIKEIVVGISAPIYSYNASVEKIEHLRQQMYLTTINQTDAYSSFTNARLTNTDELNTYTHKSSIDLIGSLSLAPDINAQDRTSQTKYIKIPTFNDIQDKVLEANAFYIIKKIPIEDALNGSYSELTTIDLSDTNLESLVNRETITDDTSTLSTYTPQTAFSFNGRLHIANYKEQLTSGYDIQTCNGLISNTTDYTNAATVTNITDNRNTYKASIPFSNMILDCDPNLRWYYFPHMYARKTTIYIKNEEGQYQKAEIPLTKHPYLNGSYWFNKFKPISFSVTNADTNTNNLETIPEQAILNKSNYLKVSEPNNPLTFTNLRTYQFDSDILALSAAVTALSQGQKGDFDLYVFTEQDGVWSLKINSEGGYSKQIPVTRDTLTNPKSVTQIDSSVLFATTRGLIELHGSQSTCISEPLDREESISLNDMPLLGAGMLTHLTQLGFTATYAATDTAHRNPILSNIQALDFRTYVQDSQILYDYRNQRIVVFKPNTAYCYSYNLRSKTWTLLSNPYSYKVNSYPDSLVVNSSNVLLNISGDSRLNNSDQQPAFLLTRPFSLDDPNNFKIIDQIRQNGTAESVSESHISQILWGSNDLISWHFISSSITGRISGQTGTPYRFFRLAIATTMTPLETLDSFSVSYRTKENNDKLF